MVLSASAFADSVTLFLSPNNGSGDNFGFLIKGSGFTFGGGGGTPYWSFNDQGYAPGSTFGGDLSLFLDNGFAQIGDTFYGYEDVVYSSGMLFLSTFTLPTNGQDFTVQVTSDFSGLATIIATGQSFNVSGSGSGTMIFVFSPYWELYFPQPVRFNNIPAAVTPEPGTLGLMATGLLSMLAFARRRHRI